jgi:hypothetical protein
MGCASANMCGNSDIGINVGGDTYLPLNFPIFMYEYGWTSGSSIPPSSGPGYSSGYYVGILEDNDTIGYFLTTQYTNNPNPNGYYDYYYSGSGWSFGIPNWYLNYYFVEDNNSDREGYKGPTNFAFIPIDQQQIPQYYQYGVFWLYNWFQEDQEGNMYIYFLMNRNIYGTSLASPEEYSFGGEKGHPIPPNPPASTINGEPIFAQSYINAYNTAFNQTNNNNYQRALYNYQPFTYGEVNNNFVNGTFGYAEQYSDQSGNTFTINYLQDTASVYNGENPYLFISAGSGGGSGFMYLDWVIVTYGVPYVVSIS